VRGRHEQPLDGQQRQLQLRPRQQAGVTAPRVQPQAPVNLVKAETEWHSAIQRRAPPQLGPGERDVDLLGLDPDTRGEPGPRLRDKAVEQRVEVEAQAPFMLDPFVHGVPPGPVVPGEPARLQHRGPGVADQLVEASPGDLDGGDGALGQGADVVHQVPFETVA
jgi:hypothetical protein